MSCNKTEGLDLAAFIVDAGTAEWDEFRLHYPGCSDCSREMASWVAIEDALSAGNVVGSAHPDVELLERFSTNRHAMSKAERSDVEQHIAACRSCADELAVHRSFDFAEFDALPAGERQGWFGSALQTAKSLLEIGRRKEHRDPEKGFRLPAPAPLAEPELAFMATTTDSSSSEPSVVAVLAGGVLGAPPQIHALRPGRTRIGRSPEAEIHIELAELTRCELEIRETNGTFEVSALNRHGELEINGMKVRTHSLVDGDLLEFSGIRMRFRTLSI